jgi:hypothetical protein
VVKGVLHMVQQSLQTWLATACVGGKRISRESNPGGNTLYWDGLVRKADSDSEAPVIAFLIS